MGLREGIGEGLKAFGHANPAIAQIADQREQFDMKQKAAMAGLVIEGVKAGTVPQEEAAQFLKNLGPQFEQLTGSGNAPPAALAGQGGGPPTPEQSEAQRTTLFSPEEKERKLTRFDAEDSKGKRFTAFTDAQGNMFVRRGGELVTAPEDTVQHRASGAGTDPQVPSPTKSERDVATRFITHRWPDDMPEMSESDKAGFIDKASSAAKEYARKNKVSFGKGLTAVWKQVMSENVEPGEVRKLLGVDWLYPDKKSKLKNPDEAAPEGTIRRKTKDGRIALFDKDQNFIGYE